MRARVFTILSVLNCLPLLGVAAWPVAALMSPMLFDSPTALNSSATWALLAALVVYPIPTIIGALLTHRNLRRRDLVRSLRSILITYSGALVILLSSAAIIIFCHGSLACE